MKFWSRSQGLIFFLTEAGIACGGIAYLLKPGVSLTNKIYAAATIVVATTASAIFALDWKNILRKIRHRAP